MVQNNIVYPSLWYVCKYCRRAFQERTGLIAHKKANHFDIILAEKKERRLADLAASKTGGAPTVVQIQQDEPSSQQSEPHIEETGKLSNPVALESPEPVITAAEPLTEVVRPMRPKIRRKKLPKKIAKSVNSRPEITKTATNDSDGSVDLFPEAESSIDKFKSLEERLKHSNGAKETTGHNTASSANTGNAQEINEDSSSSSLDEFQISRSQKNLECDICHRKFKEDRGLHLHKKFQHERVKAYPCPYCSAAFSHHRSRLGHINNAHCQRGTQRLSEPASRTGTNKPRKQTKNQSAIIAGALAAAREQKDEEPEREVSEWDEVQRVFGDTRSSTGRKRRVVATERVKQMYHCGKCNEHFGSMSEYCLHKSFHKRQAEIETAVGKPAVELRRLAPMELPTVRTFVRSRKRSKENTYWM